MYVQPSLALLAHLAELIDTGNLYDAAEIFLFSDDIYPGKETLLASLHPIAAGGLTQFTTLTWQDAVVNSVGGAEALAQLVVYNTTTLTDLPVTAHGYGIRDSAHALLLAAERFLTPVTIDRVGQQLAIVPRVGEDT